MSDSRPYWKPIPGTGGGLYADWLNLHMVTTHGLPEMRTIAFFNSGGPVVRMPLAEARPFHQIMRERVAGIQYVVARTYWIAERDEYQWWLLDMYDVTVVGTFPDETIHPNNVRKFRDPDAAIMAGLLTRPQH
jgi:hypothetical protein